MKELDEMLEKLNYVIGDNHDEDMDTPLEFEITAKRKHRKPASLEQLFDDLIDGYNEKNGANRKEFISTFIVDKENEDEKRAKVSEHICTVKLAKRDFLNVEENGEECFILLPERDGNRFNIGDRICIYTEQYRDYSFLVNDCSEARLISCSELFQGLDAAERCSLLNKEKIDPEGFALWCKLGIVKRTNKRECIPKMSTIRTRVEEFLKRIPVERNDLYNSVNSTYNRYIHCANNEKADYEEALQTKMKLVAMLLTQPDTQPAPLTSEYLSKCFRDGNVSTNNSTHRSPQWRKNILIVGSDYDLKDYLADSNHSVAEISMGGVEGNDYLFGDAMSYYCSGHGELVAKLTKCNPASIVLFKDIDLMGTSVRTSNPLYGLVSLLRRHAFTDYFLRDLEIDVSNIQFVCQVNSIEMCPELLLREMDIIVEV